MAKSQDQEINIYAYRVSHPDHTSVINMSTAAIKRLHRRAVAIVYETLHGHRSITTNNGFQVLLTLLYNVFKETCLPVIE